MSNLVKVLFVILIISFVLDSITGFLAELICFLLVVYLIKIIFYESDKLDRE